MGKPRKQKVYGEVGIERWFKVMLTRHIRERNWTEVEADFAWYGRFLETVEVQR